MARTAYAKAVSVFSRAFALSPHVANISLYLGLATLHLSAEYDTYERQVYAVNAFSYCMKYIELSTNKRLEAAYNVGRACQQIGERSLAVRYYNMVCAASADTLAAETDGVLLVAKARGNLQFLTGSNSNNNSIQQQ
jgi:hypothetical protein